MAEDEGWDAWRVPGALDGERVDRVLSIVSGLSRAEVNKVLDDGRVRVAGRTVTARSRRVRSNERLEVNGPLETATSAAPAADAGIEVPVVWSDEDVVVVDKPAGLVVHPGAGNATGTLVSGLLARFPDLAALAEGDQVDRPGIVHRLDKGTSGLLVVARTSLARDGLMAQMASRHVGRQYLTLLAGTVEADAGLIDGPLGRSTADPTRMRVQAGGRPARTGYQVLGRSGRPVPTTLVRCRLETGRTHQIRVHLASIGHPVVGDDRYGLGALKGWEPPLAHGRPFLHAEALSFDHPRSGHRLEFRSALPADLMATLAEVRLDDPALLDPVAPEG